MSSLPAHCTACAGVLRVGTSSTSQSTLCSHCCVLNLHFSASLGQSHQGGNLADHSFSHVSPVDPHMAPVDTLDNPSGGPLARRHPAVTCGLAAARQRAFCTRRATSSDRCFYFNKKIAPASATRTHQERTRPVGGLEHCILVVVSSVIQCPRTLVTTRSWTKHYFFRYSWRLPCLFNALVS